MFNTASRAVVLAAVAAGLASALVPPRPAGGLDGRRPPRCRASRRRRVAGAATAPVVAESGDGAGAATLTDFAELADKYDAFLLDQFGVVHDGRACYAGSAECVRELQERGKRVVVLSNSSKRRRDTVERLHALRCGMCTYLDAADVAPGVPAIAAFTSGDLVHKALERLTRPPRETDDDDPVAASLLDGLFDADARGGPLRAFVFGNGDDDAAYCASAGVATADVADADFLLARGLFATVGAAEPRASSFVRGDEADEILRIAADRALPMVVANPDLVRPDGKDSPMPGALAARYEAAFGGRCRRVGKPHRAIYDAALGALAAAGVTDKGRIAAIGDSMDHDVRGARDAGVDSIFVAGGIHAADLGVAQGLHERPAPATLARFLVAGESTTVRPTWVVPGFTMARS